MYKIRSDENGVYKSKEFRTKISNIVKGVKNPNYGNRWTQEQKDSLGKIRKEKGLAKGANNPKAKSIICLETGEVFKLVSAAQKRYGVKSITSFSIALKNSNRLAGNLHWKVYDNDLLNEQNRFNELVFILSQSQKYPICCVQTHETYNSRKDFLKNKKIGIKKFNKEYSKHNKITIGGNEYMYVKDYISRYM